MTRYLLAFSLAALGASTAFATVAAPVPRLTEWKVPDAPIPETPGEMEEPAKILERLTQNTKDIGDRLKDQDTGDETRKKQEQALKDIDALLKQNEPPPMDGGGGGASEMPPPPMPGGGNSGMKPPPPMGGTGQPKPMGGMGQPMPMGSGRPKRGGGDKPMPMPMGPGMKDPMMQPGGMKDPMPMPMGPGMKDPMMQPGGMNPAGGTKSNSTPPSLPNEDPFTKQVWGHLPEKLRQQASQYYREQYMPKYQEMLKQYYTNLAERDKPTKK